MGLVVIFTQKAVARDIEIPYGVLGEIVTEKSGSLNLGVPGVMYMGGIAGLMGTSLYKNIVENPSGLVGLLTSFVRTFVYVTVGGLIYSVLTITLRTNQNVTGLALMTPDVGFDNFFGGSLSQLVGGTDQIPVTVTGAVYNAEILGLSRLGVIGDAFFSYGSLTYLCIVLAVVLGWLLTKTRKGLNLRAIGENSGTTDAVGVSVTGYKYLATYVSGGTSGVGGLYSVMEYSGGTWTDNGFGNRGWLVIVLVTFALWKPVNAIWGSILFGGLYVLYLYILRLGRSTQEVFRMLSYVVTIVVLTITSLRKKWESQSPGSLGLPYFREEW